MLGQVTYDMPKMAIVWKGRGKKVVGYNNSSNQDRLTTSQACLSSMLCIVDCIRALRVS